MKPIRIVIDITGGVVNAVYCGQPVEIVFADYHKDAVQDKLENDGEIFVGTQGDPVALWMDGTDGIDEEHIVDHFFKEYAK